MSPTATVPPARRQPILSSIRTRLAAFFFLITALAVAVIYLLVAPSLQSSLQNQKLGFVQSAVKGSKGTVTKLANSVSGAGRSCAAFNAIATSLAAVTTSDVALVGVVQSPNGQLTPRLFCAGSGQQIDSPTAQIAETARANAQLTSAVIGTSGVVAFPIPPSNVAVFTFPFTDVSHYVTVITDRILLAAAIALALALITGVLVARAMTVRVLRLERAAQRVAQGDFEARFDDDSPDELGQLAAALSHMQAQLEELESARRRFIATASHELRTPIFSLGGFLELIGDEQLDEATRREFVDQVRAQVERLGKLATGLLDLSRLEAGSVALEPTSADIVVLARAIGSEFVPALSQRGSELRLALPSRPLRAEFDPDRVAQLLRILIDNAIVHTPPGTIVTLGVGTAADGRGVRVTVSDAGPGIPAPVLKRIFEPFYSADGTTGAGLGLAIAHELAERMGARLTVDSEDGHTEFAFTLAEVAAVH